MAGDWIKIEKETPEKPEIYRLAEILGVSTGDAFLACFRLWRWADSQTRDGLLRVSAAAIDDNAKIPNFHLALCEVGWLSLRNGSVMVPNFVRHMGASAKRRCLDSVRKKSAREADKKRTREEKRREENTNSIPPTPFRESNLPCHNPELAPIAKAISSRFQVVSPVHGRGGSEEIIAIIRSGRKEEAERAIVGYAEHVSRNEIPESKRLGARRFFEAGGEWERFVNGPIGESGGGVRSNSRVSSAGESVERVAAKTVRVDTSGTHSEALPTIPSGD